MLKIEEQLKLYTGDKGCFSTPESGFMRADNLLQQLSVRAGSWKCLYSAYIL